MIPTSRWDATYRDSTEYDHGYIVYRSVYAGMRAPWSRGSMSEAPDAFTSDRNCECLGTGFLHKQQRAICATPDIVYTTLSTPANNSEPSFR